MKKAKSAGKGADRRGGRRPDHAAGRSGAVPAADRLTARHRGPRPTAAADGRAGREVEIRKSLPPRHGPLMSGGYSSPAGPRRSRPVRTRRV